MGYTQTVAPATRVVSVADFKAHSRVTASGDDSLIGDYIDAAERYCEGIKNRQFITATWRMDLPYFPACIHLMPCPVQSISSVQYIDQNGDTQTLASSQYVLDTVREPALLYPAYNVTWPTTRADTHNAVQVTYVAGYGSAATDVPLQHKQLIRLLTAHWYETREPIVTGTIVAKIPFSFEALLDADSVPTH